MTTMTNVHERTDDTRQTEKVAKDDRLASATALVERVLTTAVPGPWKKHSTQQAFARAMLATPAGSPHGEIIKSILVRLAAGKKLQAGPQRASLWVASRGETPTEGAVRNRLEALAGYRASAEDSQGLKAGALVIAAGHGLESAEFVAKVVAETGTGPTWWQLTQHLGGEYTQGNFLVRALVADGWLTAGSEAGSLRPGPRFEVSS